MSEPDKPSEEPIWLPVEADDAGVTLVPVDAPIPLVVEDEPDALPGRVFDYREPTLWSRLRMRAALAVEAPLQRWNAAWTIERDVGGFFLWLPVFFGLGCLLYFNLPREPLALAFPMAALMLGVVAWRIGRGRRVTTLVTAFAVLALGASFSQWRVQRVDTQMLSQPVIATVGGRVSFVERRADGRVRYTIDIAKGGIDHRSASDIVGRIRLTARKGGPDLQIGDGISGKARVAAPSGPAYPGGYSFAFQAWFNGLSGSGFFLGAPKKVTSSAESQTGFSLSNSVARMRSAMSAIIRDALPGRNGGLATALIVGDRSGIGEETAEALRRSGLAHILAISGLHMALVTATLIATLRLLFAASSSMVLAYPVRKWTAAAGLAAAAFYLVLSGAGVSTQRAFIMVAIMLVAILCDRRALTMRNVAIAALIVLALTPEAILLPGFQMSFAAVAALVAMYEALSKRAREKGLNAKMAEYSLVRRFITRDVGGLALTSLVAGIATGLFAAYHFQRVAPLGLIANLGAMPLVSIIVMPLALLSVVAMPFGLEAWPLWLMSIGIDGVVTVAQWVSSRGPQGNTGLLPVATVALGAMGLLVLCLLKTRLRLLGLVFVVLAGVTQSQRSAPDILIMENGAQIGLLDGEGGLTLMRPRAEKFTTTIWKRAYAPSQLESSGNALEEAALKFQCDELGCVARHEGKLVVHAKSSAALLEDCLLADVLVVPFFAPDACSGIPASDRPMIIDRSRLARHGSHALTMSDDTIDVVKAFSAQPRPWTKHRQAK